MANIIKSYEPRNDKTCVNCKNARLICMKDGTVKQIKPTHYI